MESDLHIRNGVVIPGYEIEISASRSGGPGGQHVNKVSTRITVRWNVKNSVALNEVQKIRALQNLQNILTKDGDLIIHSGSERSQIQNKKLALEKLAHQIKKALFVPRKRMKTKISKGAKEKRLQQKAYKSDIKKTRSKKNFDF